jgi:hypothetical protein
MTMEENHLAAPCDRRPKGVSTERANQQLAAVSVSSKVP